MGVDVRRTATNPTLPLFTDPTAALSSLVCAVCGAHGVTIVAMARNQNGAWERGFCGPDCAHKQGWPWLVSETQRRSNQ